jgi:opacity protein-like surface antigen
MEKKMKKTLSLLALLALSGMACGTAQASERYISGLAGVSWMNDIEIVDTEQPSDAFLTLNTDGGFTATGALGCDYGTTRAELELGYQHNSIKSGSWYDVNEEEGGSGAFSGSVNIMSLMANGFYDIDLGGGTELYAMAGVGVAQVSFKELLWVEEGDDYTDSFDETTLAWQVGAGLAVPVGDKVKLDLRYRYFATTDLTPDDVAADFEVFEETGKFNVSSHSVLLGMRITL